MSLDIFDSSNYDNDKEEKSLEDTLKPEAKAGRRDVVDTAIRNKIEGASSLNEYIEKAYNYAEEYDVFGINDWLKDGSQVLGREEIEKWANNLPYPLDDVYYLN